MEFETWCKLTYTADHLEWLKQNGYSSARLGFEKWKLEQRLTTALSERDRLAKVVVDGHTVKMSSGVTRCRHCGQNVRLGCHDDCPVLLARQILEEVRGE